MRVLVTGAAGFLGRHLVARLRARGDTVVAVDRAPGGIQADICDPAAMAAAARGCEGVIHAAALTALWSRDPGAFERVNHQGTCVVLDAAARAGASRAVLVSSYTTLVTGTRATPPQTRDETVEIAPENLLGPYPAAKRRGELAALASALPPAIVLPTAPLGPGDATPTPPGAMLLDLARGRLPAFPRALWDFVDVRAVADGTIAALDRGTPGRRYLLGGGALETEAFLSMFSAVSGIKAPLLRVPHGLALAAAHASEGWARLSGVPPAAPLTGVRLSAPPLRFDSARARAELSHAPPPLEVTLADALAWFRAHGHL